MSSVDLDRLPHTQVSLAETEMPPVHASPRRAVEKLSPADSPRVAAAEEAVADRPEARRPRPEAAAEKD